MSEQQIKNDQKTQNEDMFDDIEDEQVQSDMYYEAILARALKYKVQLIDLDYINIENIKKLDTALINQATNLGMKQFVAGDLAKILRQLHADMLASLPNGQYEEGKGENSTEADSEYDDQTHLQDEIKFSNFIRPAIDELDTQISHAQYRSNIPLISQSLNAIRLQQSSLVPPMIRTDSIQQQQISPNLLQPNEIQRAPSTGVADSMLGNSTFLHSYSSVIVNKLQLDATKNDVPIGKLIFMPLQDRYQFISQLIRKIFTTPVSPSSDPTKILKVLIVSPSHNIGGQLYLELVKFNSIKAKGDPIGRQQLGQGIHNQLPNCQNFCSKAHKHMKTCEDFYKYTKQFNIVLLNSKLCYDYLIHGVMYLHSYDYIIFEDLSQSNDSNPILMIKDYYYDTQLTKLPQIIAMFSQKPKSDSNFELRGQLQKYANDFHSEFMSLDQDEVQRVKSYYKCVLPMKIDNSTTFAKQLCDVMPLEKLQQKILVIVNEEILKEKEQETFSSKKELQSILAHTFDLYFLRNQSSLIPRGASMEQQSAKLLQNERTQSTPQEEEMKGEIIVISLEQLRRNGIGIKEVTTVIYYSDFQEGSRNEIDVREVIMHLSLNSLHPLQIIPVKETESDEIYENWKEYINQICESRIEAFTTKVLPTVTHKIKPQENIRSLKRRDPQEYYIIRDPKKIIPDGRDPKLTIKDSYQVLEDITLAIAELCSHDQCSQLTNQDQIIKDKLNAEFALKCDKELRLRRKPNPVITEKSLQNKRYFLADIIFPHCAKQHINYVLYDQGFTKKKDAEAHTALKAIKMLYEKKKINKYFDLAFTKPAEQTLISFPNLFRHYNDYIQRPIPIPQFNESASQKMYVHVFSGKNPQQDFYPFVNGPQNYIGFLSSTNLNYMDLDYQVYQENRQRHLHMDYLITSGRVLTREEALQETQSKNMIDYTMNNAIEIELPVDTQAANNVLQRFKFFHMWSFYQMMGLDYTFLKDLMKGSFTFCNALFGAQLKEIWDSKRNISDFLKEHINRSNTKFEEKELLTIHRYLIPITRSSKSGMYIINHSLIDNVVRYFQTKLLSIQNGYQSHLDTMSIECDNIMRHLWNSNVGYKQVTKVKVFNQKHWNKLPIQAPSKSSSLSLGSPTKDYNEFLHKGDKLTFPQYQALQLGQFISRKESKFKIQVHKLPQFLDCSPSKPLLAIDEMEYSKQALMEGQIEDELSNYAQIPSELVELFPLTYEQYSVMQHACTHLLKLNDYLRAEEFINRYFGEESHKFKFIPAGRLFNFPEMLGDRSEQINTKTDVRTILFKNLPLINEALTSPHTQLLRNYERLEIYGDALNSLLVIVELYLNRTDTDTEDELDFQRKERISNDALILINCKNEISQYMMIEPQSQLPQLSDPHALALTQSSKNHTIMRSLMPGGLGDSKFQKRLKKIKQMQSKQKFFNIDLEISRAIRDRQRVLSGDSIQNANDFNQFKELLRLILTKEPWRVQLKERLPEIFKIYIDVLESNTSSSRTFHLVDEISLIAYQSTDKRAGDLKIMILEMIKEKLMKSAQTFTMNKYPLEQKPSISDRDPNKMELRVSKDKKMADVIESLSGAITQTCGIHVGFQFLYSLGILKTDYEALTSKIMNENVTDKESLIAIADIEKDFCLNEVESILDYKFKHMGFLVSALTHKSFADYANNKYKSKLKDYNLMEFLGDSILNFFVLDFFFKNSRNYQSDYPPNVLHRLKSEIVNNNFLSLIMIENGLHKKVLKVEKQSFNQKFDQYVNMVLRSVQGENSASATQNIYANYFVNENPEQQYKYDFMDPIIMKENAEKTKHVRQDMEDIQHFCIKVFGDVFEAIVAAIFIDSGGDLSETHRVVMKLLEPYLYVYGNSSTTLEHPRTQIIDLWARQPFSSIRDYPIKISHLKQDFSLNCVIVKVKWRDRRSYIKGSLVALRF